MTDPELLTFLGSIAPRLGLRPAGYRRVHATVRKRLARRLAALGLDLPGYLRHLEAQPEEWEWLDGCCRITISRFGRDAVVFAHLAARALPEVAAGARAGSERRVRIWSAGCASGEEAYATAIAFHVDIAPLYPELELDILGTDLDPSVLARARSGGPYPSGCLRELPARWLAFAFEQRAGQWWLRPDLRDGVRFEALDLRCAVPSGTFDIILCRNAAFTYFERQLQERVAARIAAALRPGGSLILGVGEDLPERSSDLIPAGPCFYTRGTAS